MCGTMTMGLKVSYYRRHIRDYISEGSAKTWACSMIDGWLDYCNALLYVTAAANIHKLHRVQESMARAVTNSRRSEHIIKHVLASFHWLPVEYRIQYKLAVTTFKVLTTQKPSYLSELIRFHTLRATMTLTYVTNHVTITITSSLCILCVSSLFRWFRHNFVYIQLKLKQLQSLQSNFHREPGTSVILSNT